jgi:hypothetical protein
MEAKGLRKEPFLPSPAMVPLMTQHPITPPRELVQQWYENTKADTFWIADHQESFATRAAQWGADQELEACCEWLRNKDILEPAIDALRADRRPKPPSLKEQALETLQRISKDKYPCNYQEDSDWDTIRRALEQLSDEQ